MGGANTGLYSGKDDLLLPLISPAFTTEGSHQNSGIVKLLPSKRVEYSCVGLGFVYQPNFADAYQSVGASAPFLMTYIASIP